MKIIWILALLSPALVGAAPDEEKLGKLKGYPVGTAATWFFDESVRVGSFTHQAEIPNISAGGTHTLQPSSNPMKLPAAARAPDYRWSTALERNLTIDDYLNRQRIMGLLIIKDGEIQVERYQYDRNASHRFLSNSMAKSITALAIGIALEEGHIKSLDDRADAYAPALAGTLYGETTIRNLLRMASGVRFKEDYSGMDDLSRYVAAVGRGGIEAGAQVMTEREHPQGTRFNYASAESDVLSLVIRGATGESLSAYLTPRLWQAIGAETSAIWRTDRTGHERSGGNFNATLRDYARLGIVLAHDGHRPDLPQQKPVISTRFLMEATDWRMAPAAFRPGQATAHWGYGYKFWLFPGNKRRFALIGVYGQVIFVDPELKLVMVQTAANATAMAGKTSLGAEMNALWRGLVAHYGAW